MKLILILLAAAADLPGAPETELKDGAGQTIIRYVVEAPAGLAPAGVADPAKQVGLFLCFPEHDRPTGDEILPVREALRRQGLLDHYVLLAGHPQGQKFGAVDHAPIQKLIAWALKTYPINPRRIYMYGKGEGGKISGEMAGLHPKLVTAAISYSWGWWTMPAEVEAPIDAEKTAPEFYMVLGLRDLPHHLTTVRDTYSRVQAKGYHVIYREFDDLGARTYHPPSNDDAVAWATRLRNKNIPPSPAELKLMQRGSASGLALVGGAVAGEAIQRMLASPDAAVRAAAAEACSQAIFSEQTLAALGKTLGDPDAGVRRAALRAIALNAQWRSAAAQQALIEAVKPGHADRVSAVDAIAQALRFQVKGVQQDPPLFAALAGLLTDQEEELRVMAANTLAPIRDRDFRGDLGRPEKKSPEGGWPQWIAEITAKAAGYRKDYDVCRTAVQPPVDLFCAGERHLLAGRPAQALQSTLQAAEQGYVPAAAALGMMFAIGKGAPQDLGQAAKWWNQAAAGGHALAKLNAGMVPKRPSAPAPAPR